MIEDAYRSAPGVGLEVWCVDQAGPFQTAPCPGRSWQPAGRPARLPHEYVHNGTAKVMTLFHPTDGQVRVEGVTACPNTVLHPWLKQELTAILAALPDSPATAARSRAAWDRWQRGLDERITLPTALPPLRVLLVLDNLAGHKTPAFVLWLFAHGVMPLYTPVGGSWLNMAESIQRVLKGRALDGQHPTHPNEIIAWFQAVTDPGIGTPRRSSGAGSGRLGERGNGIDDTASVGRVRRPADPSPGGMAMLEPIDPLVVRHY